MSRNLKNNFEKLKFLASVKDPVKRKRILMAIADPTIYSAMNEIAVNTIKGRVKLNNSQKRKLNKFGNVLKRLSVKTKDKKLKRKLVVQSGGFLPILIPAIASIITSLIESKS